MELLAPDFDRIEPIVARAMARVPALADAGVKTVVNGPITFTPDANPLIGPVFGLRNAWLLTGSSMGVMEGGGAGEFLADWIVDGAPPRDPLVVDARRFGDFADRDYRLDKAIECFGLQFGVHYPFEERRAGRLRRVTPVYDSQASAGAVFGCAYGWERPNWFSQGEPDAEATLTFARPDWLDAVGAECRAVRDSVGIADLSAFSKFEVTGSGAARFVESLGANRAPRKAGRICLTHALTVAGGIESEFTVTRLSEAHFYFTSAAAAERRDEDLLRCRAGHMQDVQIANRTRALGIVAIMGPAAREVLAARTDADLGNDAFPWLTAADIRVAGVPVRALRMSYVGELGWELHLPLAQMARVYDALVQAGQAFGIRPFGAFAMNAMRLEKGYRAWGADLTSERTPLESGLEPLVRTEGRRFIGREALLARARQPDAWRMVLLELAPHERRLPFAAHTVLQDDCPVGIVTSGAFGHRTGKTLALAYLTPKAGPGDCIVDIVGERIDARVLGSCPYDPDNRRPRDA
jgi:dimethylglycine dehydrogenase